MCIVCVCVLAGPEGGTVKAGDYYRTSKHRKLSNTLCPKNDTDVAHCKFNAHQLILAIFGTEMLLREHNIK